jgi:uncharacterized membrane protein
MTVSYNQIAGRSVERLAALSDGVFAVAVTLLVLDLRLPAADAVYDERGLWHMLAALALRLLMYTMTFLTLGIFWVGQQTQFNHLARSERSLSWIRIAFLFGVSHTILNHIAGGIPEIPGRACHLLAEPSVAG